MQKDTEKAWSIFKCRARAHAFDQDPADPFLRRYARMITLCTFLSPFVNTLQQIVNFAWFPLTFLGSPTPSLSEVFGGVLGCTL